jgi:aspartyl-tRNA(Asn)/glutamyl-tRNA(Gln) amidotransferase subunit B
MPLCEHGYLDIEAGGPVKRVGITRIHMEEDAGKISPRGRAIAWSTSTAPRHRRSRS